MIIVRQPIANANKKFKFKLLPRFFRLLIRPPVIPSNPENVGAFAEKISAEEFDVKKMLVISGIGAKEYYKKLGYIRDGVYMSKFL